ncbi:T9SS type A sorting domain-containing protein [Rhodothermus marinus]|uniref:T9SS type A sorting domain-containing protein n=1 Tax=Rhodothermus marinus TaxID=29549 RepID=UPI001F54E69B|nr:T9SS type A sorting domain-containing protein [Rhodothermus marinus]
MKRLLFGFLVFVATAQTLQAQTFYTFTGEGGSGNWNLASNWDPEGVPGPDDIAFIPDRPPDRIFDVWLTSSVTVGKLIVGRDNTFDLRNYTLTLQQGGSMAEGSRLLFGSGSVVAVLADSFVVRGEVLFGNGGRIAGSGYFVNRGRLYTPSGDVTIAGQLINYGSVELFPSTWYFASGGSYTNYGSTTLQGNNDIWWLVSNDNQPTSTIQNYGRWHVNLSNGRSWLVGYYRPHLLRFELLGDTLSVSGRSQVHVFSLALLQNQPVFRIDSLNAFYLRGTTIVADSVEAFVQGSGFFGQWGGTLTSADSTRGAVLNFQGNGFGLGNGARLAGRLLNRGRLYTPSGDVTIAGQLINYGSVELFPSTWYFASGGSYTNYGSTTLQGNNDIWWLVSNDNQPTSTIQNYGRWHVNLSNGRSWLVGYYNRQLLRFELLGDTLSVSGQSQVHVYSDLTWKGGHIQAFGSLNLQTLIIAGNVSLGGNLLRVQRIHIQENGTIVGLSSLTAAQEIRVFNGGVIESGLTLDAPLVVFETGSRLRGRFDATGQLPMLVATRALQLDRPIVEILLPDTLQLTVGQQYTLATSLTGSLSGQIGYLTSSSPRYTFTPTVTPTALLLTVVNRTAYEAITLISSDSLFAFAENQLLLASGVWSDSVRVLLQDPDVDTLITGQFTPLDAEVASISLDLSDVPFIGPARLVVDRVGFRKDTLNVFVRPTLSVAVWRESGIVGIPILPPPYSRTFYLDLINATNYTQGPTYYLLKFAIDAPAVRIQAGPLVHLNPDDPTESMILLKMRPWQIIRIPVVVGIDPQYIIWELPQAGKRPLNEDKDQIKLRLPFGKQVTLSKSALAEISRKKLKAITVDAIFNAANICGALGQVIFPPETPPSWNEIIDAAVDEVLEQLPPAEQSLFGQAKTTAWWYLEQIIGEIIDEAKERALGSVLPAINVVQTASDCADAFGQEFERHFKNQAKSVVDSYRAANQDGDISPNDELEILTTQGLKATNGFGALWAECAMRQKDVLNQPPCTPLPDGPPYRCDSKPNIRGPWDPNDKTTASANYACEVGTVEIDGKTEQRCVRYFVPLANAADSIVYTIQFENRPEATAPAERVVIRDTLSAFLDPASFQLLSASHDSLLTVSIDGNVLTFTYEGINLPPNVNPPEGEGFVTFSIRPRGVQEGTVIRNRASIVFDYNPPILTPEVVHEFTRSVEVGLLAGILSDTLTVGLSREWSFIVYNEGPDTANALRVYLLIPSSLSVRQLAPPEGWSCVQLTDRWACDGSNLGPGDSAHVRLDIEATVPDTGVVTAWVRMRAGEVRGLENNESSIRYLIRPSPVAVSSPDRLPENPTLEGPYPNPFTTRTTFRIGLPGQRRVRLIVYDVLGRELARIVDGELPAGWHELRWEASALASGIYFVRFEADRTHQVRSFLKVH